MNLMGDWVPVEKGRGILFEKQSLGYGQVVVSFFSPNMYFFLTQMILGRKLTGKTMKFLLFIFVGVVHLLPLASGKAIHGNGTSQRTFQEIKEEIAHYGDVAKAIINFTVYGKGQNRSYERLALLVIYIYQVLQKTRRAHLDIIYIYIYILTHKQNRKQMK